MAFEVDFAFVDSYGRKTNRRWHNVAVDIAGVNADIAVILPLLNAAIEGGVQAYTVKQTSVTGAFSASATSNIDDNASLDVTGEDGYNYDFNLPMIDPSLVLPGGAINTGSASITNLLALFQGANNWRVNLRHPTKIAAIVGGFLDK